MDNLGFDFDDIAQSDLDMEIDLADGDIGINDFDVRQQEGFSYPAMLITGVKFNDTLRVLRALRRKTFRLCDVWVDLDDGNPPVKQGTLPADSTIFLAMRTLGLGVILYTAEDTVIPLDLGDPESIADFI